MPQQEIQYIRLGEQITRLVKSLATEKSWSMTYAMNYIGLSTQYGTDMIYRWRQGKVRPRPQVIEILAQIGRKETNLTREWGESLLKAAQHPDALDLTNALWGPKQIRSIPCNLPSREHVSLIGRQTDMRHLLELLSTQYGAHLITVDGIGGVGKTALVLEVAYQCWDASKGEKVSHDLIIPSFDAIVFVSARQQHLISGVILPSSEAKRTLRAMFHEIASALSTEITRFPSEEHPSLVRTILARQHTLLIVDNLETMIDKKGVISYLYELPPSVKVVITTRESFNFSPISLEQLSLEETIVLIEREAHYKHLTISREQGLAIYRHIGGIPAALIYAIGQIANGFSLETILAKIPRVGSDVARFCFEGSVDLIREQKAHNLLMAMALFPKAPLQRTVANVAGLVNDLNAAEEGLVQLQTLSLVRYRDNRYTMLPLTREYALSELAAHPIFEREACQRWIDWYLNFTKEYGGKDWKEWHTQYEHLAEEWENLLAVFEWCVNHDEYHAMQVFWQVNYLVKFTHIYGLWDDRLIWLEWLIKAGIKQGDWSNAIRAMVDRGSTLTLIGRLKDAEEQLKQAWDMHHYANTWEQIILIAKIANLHTYQKHYTEALQWLDQAQYILSGAQFDEREHMRRQADLSMNRGNIYYQQRSYDRAKSSYQEVFSLAQTIDWYRMAVLAEIYLAIIAIAQDLLDEAENMLTKSLPIAGNNVDKRLTAMYRQALAQLYKAQGKMIEAFHWAKKALEGFEQLEMRAEAAEIKELLQSLNTNI